MSEISPHDESLQEAIRTGEMLEADRRRFIYADVEELLRFGFLTLGTVLSDTPVVMRSLSAEGRVRMHHRGMVHETKYMAWVVAESVYMIDGVAVPPNSDGTYLVYEWAYQLPMHLIYTLFSTVRGLHNRVDRALYLVEAYSYEPYSKSMWMARPTPEVNSVYDTWVSLNRASDEVDSINRNWRYVGTLSSSWSKGGQSILESVNQETAKERSRRHKVIEDTVNNVLRDFKSDKEVIQVTLDGKVFEVPSVTAPQTVEDLIGEMHRVMSGNSDYHDEVVAKYKEGIRTRVEAQRHEHLERVAIAQQIMQDEIDAGRPPIIGYTVDQISGILPDVPHQPKVADASASNRLFDRYLASPQGVGWIGAGGTPEPATLAGIETGGKTLQDRIASKHPTLDTVNKRGG